MNQHNVEIILHVDDDLEANDRETLVNDLEGQTGIRHAHFTYHRPHLMVVDYDPTAIHAIDVLAVVQREHLHAELIGGI